jgi:hypothetical protein
MCVSISIYMFAIVIVPDFVDRGFITQDFWSSKQVEHFLIKDFYYEQVLMANCISDSWQDRMEVLDSKKFTFFTLFIIVLRESCPQNL